MEKRVSADLGSTTTGVMDVVALHGNEIRRASQVDGPVVMAVASGGPAGRAIKLIIGDGDTVRSVGAQDDHLATNEGDL